jgi:replicative DNA helicase
MSGHVLENDPVEQALALNTPTPTPDGWRRMAKVVVGDRIYDAQGRIRRVVTTSSVREGQFCYSLTLSSDERFVTDGNHLWPVLVRGYPRLHRTGELCRRYNGQWRGGIKKRYRVGLCQALDGGDRSTLPVPPYALGVWLGDGSRGSAEFC